MRGRLLHDLRLALRAWRGSRLVALTAVTTLGLAIAANGVVASGLRTLLLDPLPIDDADRIVWLSESTDQLAQMSVSLPNYRDWQAQSTVFSSFGAFRSTRANLTGGDEPERVEAAQVSAAVLTALAVRPRAGRLFSAVEDNAGAERVALVRESLWRRRLGGGDLATSWLTLDGESYRVIGVLPDRFRFPGDSTEVWLPLEVAASRLPQERGFHPGLYGLGRLKEGVSLEAAQAEMAAIARRLEEEYPATNRGHRIAMVTLRERAVGEARPFLLLLSAAVALVLLIACLNVANLLLAHAAERSTEMATRAALGAGRRDLLRQTLAESALLGLASGALGLLLAFVGLRLLVASLPAALPARDRLGVDGWVLGFTLVVSLLTGLACGLGPILSTTRPDLRRALVSGARQSGSRTRRRLRDGFVVFQVGAALMLLIGATLVIESVARLAAVDPGFDAEGVLTARIALPDSKYGEPARWGSFFDRLLGELAALPGVEAVGVTSALPLASGAAEAGVAARDSPPEPGAELPFALIQVVSPGYFPALGIELRQGRLLADSDRADSAAVVVIDEKLADQLWPGGEAAGRQLSFEASGPQPGAPPRWHEVVGVVRHVRFYELESESRGEVYVPFRRPPAWFQASRPAIAVVMRTAADPLGLAPGVRRAVWAIDSDQPVYRVATMRGLISERLLGRRLAARLLAAFALLALVVAAVGTHGVVAYAVAQRRRELGVRIALGAAPKRAAGLVLARGMGLVGAGLALGLAGAWAMRGLLASTLYGASGSEPLPFLLLPLAFALVGFAACYLPARRASRVDPMVALRPE